jgi:hypothetical protein
MLPVAVALRPLLHGRMVGLGCGGFDSVVRETNDSFRPVCNRLEQDLVKVAKKDVDLVFCATLVPGVRCNFLTPRARRQSRNPNECDAIGTTRMRACFMSMPLW